MRDLFDGRTKTTDVQQRCFEPHFTIGALAQLWGFSEDTLRREFENEPHHDLLWLPEKKKPGKRRYRSFRVPLSVALRVYRRLTNAA